MLVGLGALENAACCLRQIPCKSSRAGMQVTFKNFQGAALEAEDTVWRKRELATTRARTVTGEAVA